MRYVNCDILIIGCGPAGAACAKAAASTGAKANVKVIVAERRNVIGQPVRCAEYIPAMLVGQANVGKDYIVQKIIGMRSFLDNQCIQDLQSPGYIINRDLFDQALAKSAQEAGAQILLNHSLLHKGRRSDNAVLLHVDGINGTDEQVLVQAKIIIGADGPYSRIAHWIHGEQNPCLPAIQVRVPLRKELEFTHIYFDEHYTGGYAWLFPKNNVANVGLGMMPKAQGFSLQQALEYLIQNLVKENVVENRVLCKFGGRIPIGKPRAFVKDNLLLVGDAAGHTHPITGAGIFQAVIGGEMAGRFAAQAILENDLSLLNEYTEAWEEFYGDTLSHAYSRRQMWDAHKGALDLNIRKVWIGFREYYYD